MCLQMNQQLKWISEQNNCIDLFFCQRGDFNIFALGRHEKFE